MYQTADYIETIERHHSTNDTYRSFNITIESEFQILQSVLQDAFLLYDFSFEHYSHIWSR